MVVDATKAADGAKQDTHQHALFEAISKSDLEAVRKNLKEEPEWQTLRDDMNRTPLMAACLYDNTEIVTEIIEAIEDKHSEVNTSTTPSRNPAMESPEMKKILTVLALSGEKLRNVEMRKHTALVIASEEGHLSILQLLLKHGADINQNHGSTALRSACMRGHLDCVQWLLENSADASLVNKDTGSTPLLAAVLKGSEEIVALLLKHGNNGLNTAVTAMMDSVRCMPQPPNETRLYSVCCSITEPIYTQPASEVGPLWTTSSYVGPWAFRKRPSWWTCCWPEEPRYHRARYGAASIWAVGYALSRHYGQAVFGNSLLKRWTTRPNQRL